MKGYFDKYIKPLNDGLAEALDQNELYKLRGFVEKALRETIEEVTHDEGITTGEYHAMIMALNGAYHNITGDHRLLFNTTMVFNPDKVDKGLRRSLASEPF